MRLLPLALLVYSAPGGTLLHDWSLDAENVRIADGEHGYESLTATIRLSEAVALRVHDALQVPYVVLTCGAAAWEGRLEDKQVVARGLSIVALGSWRALSDYGPYVCLWSDTSTARWAQITPDLLSGHNPEKWNLDNNNRIYIAPVDGEQFSGTQLGGMYYSTPSRSRKQIQAIQFEYEFLAPSASWKAYLNRYTSGFGGVVNYMTLSGSGALQSGAYYLEPANADLLAFYMAWTGIKAAYTGETGVGAYFRATKIRVATTTTNKINTSIAAGIGSTGSQSPTPVSLDHIYVGQHLVIGSGSTGEIVTVTDVDDGAGTFTAVFAKTHAAGVTVKAIFIPASEIVQDVVAATNGVNSSQLGSSTADIQASDMDRDMELFEDIKVQDVVSYLADEGASVRYEAGVWDGRRAYFRPQGSRARAWYTDVVQLTLGSTLETLVNQAYATFRQAGGTLQRTADADDALSQSRYGIVRRGVTQASTTSEGLAEIGRDGYLAERSTITPRIQIATEGLFDASGIEYPLWMLCAGDTLELRNLSPTLSTEVDRIRQFRVSRKEYDVDGNILYPTPELAIPDVAVMIARPQIKQARQDVKADYALPALAAMDTY